MLPRVLSAVLAVFVGTAITTASTLTPPVLPLIVRNPYLSIWFQHARENPWDTWPMFYTGSTVGFAIMAKVPETGSVYPLLGRPQDFLREDDGYTVAYPDYEGAAFDASTTNLTYIIQNPADVEGSVRLILSFLSPITPTSTFRQALPATYLTIYAEGSFDVSVYADVNGEWVSGDRENEISWKLQEPEADRLSSTIKTWKVARRSEQLLTEVNDHAEWGTLHFSGPADSHHQSGDSRLLRRQFAKHGHLKDEIDETFRKMFDQEPVFAFSKTLKLSGDKTTTGSRSTDSALFTFALIQDPVVQYAAARGLTQMRPLWASYFDSADACLEYHYFDFPTAVSLAKNYSDQLAHDAFASGSQDYQDIAALSARQVFGATQWSGTPESPILFLKEISSNGNFQTVDVIFPAFPFFLYTNPQWLAYLLEPLLEHQLSGQYPNDYSMHDLGTHFPNATGHPDGADEYMPVEECGNMLIMGLALVNALRHNSQPAFTREVTNATRLGIRLFANSVSFDAYGIDKSFEDVGTTGEKAATKWAKRSYTLWKKWTGYLVRESLIPANQLCTDDFAGWLANQTNLALKGIVGVRAMSDIATIVGEPEEAKHYKDIASEYIGKWQEYGISRDKTHAKLAYTWYGSWTTIYNLYADALLCFHNDESSSPASAGNVRGSGQKHLDGEVEAVTKGPFIPDYVYQMHSDWYLAVLQRYGLPLDSRHLYTKSDWEFFAAAVTSKQTRSAILQSVALWVNETSTDRPLTDLYDTEGDGGFPGPNFFARPVVGGHFAFLALERACGGKAVQSLEFLDRNASRAVNVAKSLKADLADWDPSSEEL